MMMNTFNKILVVVAVAALCGSVVLAQESTPAVQQDAVYDRPFINIGETQTAEGGYVEGNTNYFSEDGVSDGFTMELRRFNVFLYSQIGARIRFLSELEFEHGTEEIALETAMLDLELSDALNFRAGIILPVIGFVNTNHDSPKWEFIERPISSVGIIPTTLSEVGFGVHGKLFLSENSIISYDAYLVNGLQDGVILNAEGRTDLASGKSEGMFAEDNNGEPMLNGRISYTNRSFGEFGLSYYGGVYNSFQSEGEETDEKRSLSLAAVDFSTEIAKLQIKGEMVLASIDVPDDIEEIYGENQFGGFIDLVYPLLQMPVFNFENAVVKTALRFEYADFNAADFSTNIATEIGDENVGVALGLSFQPRPGTLIRANYRHHWITDILGNPAVRMAGFQFGIASYF